ncbi:MAG: ATP-binding cassette, subfamily B [Chloroflexi bacterium]|jgi:ATP-binding cassette subfamily B protein|nr:MAG: ATP-binding cassette, subfamily B [Chloroflexota bacterium]
MNLGLGGMSASRGQADEEFFGSAYDQKVILRLLPYIKPFMPLVIASFVSMLIYTFTLVAVPWLIQWGIDNPIRDGLQTATDYKASASQAGEETNLTQLKELLSPHIKILNILFVVFIINAFTNWGTNYLQQYAMQRVGQGVLYRLRRALFGHVQKQSLSYFDKTEVGRLMSRVQGDVGQLQEFAALVVMSLGELLSLVGIVIALLVMDLELGLITMAVLPVLMTIMVIWQKYAKRSFSEIRTRIAIVNAAFNENISGVRVVQSLNRQQRNLEIFDEKNIAHRWSNVIAGRYAAGLLPAVDILTAVAIGLALYFGSKLVGLEEGQLLPGVLVAFVMYVQRFFDPIRNLTQQYTQLQRSMASGARIFDLMDREPELIDIEDAIDMPEIKGNIEFKNVRFKYVEGEDVLKGINLTMNAGETVAVVGPTGAGKTSIVSILSRFYPVKREEGAILIDGIDIRDVKRASVVSQMSMVLQEPYLFSGTVMENIKYNHVHVTDAKAISSAKVVGAHEFIMQLEGGYDTFLSERGANISLGQRQLISFARAIVDDPKILILDEATASIDSHTELVIQTALRKLLEGRTAIVIAHRLSTIRGADKIVVLESGEVAEEGNHQELMDKDGLYAHLYNMNFQSIEDL